MIIDFIGAKYIISLASNQDLTRFVRRWRVALGICSLIFLVSDDFCEATCFLQVGNAGFGAMRRCPQALSRP
jgi:hypothetical protein